jgi:hypothetical protein
MDYFYDGQIRRYVTQFMRVFIGFKYKAGDGEEKNVPVLYGDMTRQVASIIKDNSENKMMNVPRMACYISGLEMDMSRMSDATFVSKVNIRERRYSDDGQGGREYENNQGGNYTVERLMPTPFKLSMKADLWTSNTDQKLQLLEQILVLFNPSLELQTTDNYIDWTSLSVLDLTTINFSSRTVPSGESEIDICSMEFAMPIWITPPAKVKKLGVVQSIISNVFSESGELQTLEDLVYNRAKGSFDITTNRYRVLLFKSQNGQPYDYDLTLVNPDQAVLALGIDQKEFKAGAAVDWMTILDIQGSYVSGTSQAHFKQASGYYMVGTFTVNPVDPTVIVVTFDQDTIPSNTLIASSIAGISSRGTVDAIIDPYKYNPIETYGGHDNIPLGIRYLMLDDVNTSQNRGGFIKYPNDPSDGSSKDPYRGPTAWRDKNGTDPIIMANSIIEWNGTTWIEIWDPDTGVNPTYMQNLRTGIQYRWDGLQWLKAFEGEYAPGFWNFVLIP